MNIEDLRCKICELQIPTSLYNLEGDCKRTAGATSLTLVGDIWRVYTCDERNQLLSSYWFNTKSDACSFIYQNIIDYIDFRDKLKLLRNSQCL